ncbi:hypothetical protein DMUE_0141 [Dictyocoela muelleri]|nr:hypothetical protein DMUE_0141 [Dictyocoela muelleri]
MPKLQSDETVLLRGRIIRRPTLTDDSTPDIVRILGIIDTVNKQNYLQKRVENGQLDIFVFVMRNKHSSFGTFKTDVYLSYPSVVNELGLKQKIVKNNDGFVNEFGDHTNDIE